MIEEIFNNFGWAIAIGLSAWVLMFGFFLRGLARVLKLQCEHDGNGRGWPGE